MESASAAQLNTPLIDNISFGPSHASVVPATYHPAEKAAHPPTAKRSRISHAVPLRQASLTPKRPVQNPVVMARVTEFASTNEMAPPPMIVIFRSTELRAEGAPQLRTVTAAQPVTSVRSLQSSENPALQIHLIQIIDPVTGTPMQVLEIMLVMPPQPGSPSQSI
jgi:hypothetical protein